jgi:hypothetical protein
MIGRNSELPLEVLRETLRRRPLVGGGTVTKFEFDDVSERFQPEAERQLNQ